MYLRVFLLAVVLGLSGCDVLEEIQPDPAVPFSVDAIRVEAIPVSEWDDDGTPPDVFVEIQNAAGATIVSSAVVPDADLTQPLVVSVENPVESPTEDSRLFVVVFDDDGGRLNSERIGGSMPFTVQDVRDADGGELVLEDLRAGSGHEITYTLVL